MNKPPIKQKPLLKPKPLAKPIDLKGKLANLKLNDKENDAKLNNNDVKLVKIEETSYQNELKVLDKNQLNKAFQLLNQSSLAEKEDTLEYDIRIDEDQIETCNQIINILLNAGYFRANINGLSEFDKVRHILVNALK